MTTSYKRYMTSYSTTGYDPAGMRPHDTTPAPTGNPSHMVSIKGESKVILIHTNPTPSMYASGSNGFRLQPVAGSVFTSVRWQWLKAHGTSKTRPTCYTYSTTVANKLPAAAACARRSGGCHSRPRRVKYCGVAATKWGLNQYFPARRVHSRNHEPVNT